MMFCTASPCNVARRYKTRLRLSLKRVSPPKERKPRKPIRSPKRDEVAELLSVGLEFDQIADHVGITIKAAKRHFEKICKLLGPQAC
jgi:DNA-binding NarL/FixJ family response regulator